VERAVEKMLSKEPADRFDTINDAKAALLGTAKVGYTVKRNTVIVVSVSLIFIAAIAALMTVLWPKQSAGVRGIDQTKVAEETKQETKRAERPADEYFRRWVETHPKMTTFKNREHPQCMHMLSDDALAALRGNQSLTCLDLSGCKEITNDGLSNLAASPLEILDLEGTDLTDHRLKALEAISSLQNLNLSDSGVGEEACVSIAKLDNLRELNLSKTRVRSAGIAKLGGLNNLTELYLNRCDITGSLKFLQSSNLIQLSLHHDKLSKDDLIALTKMPSLARVVLSDSNISSADLMKLSAVKTLLAVDVRHCQAVDDTGLRRFAKASGCELHSDFLNFPLDVKRHPHMHNLDSSMNIVVNKTFDLPDEGRELKPGSTEIKGWKVIRGSVTGISSKQFRDIAQMNQKQTFLALNVNGPGGIEQSLTTKPGAEYHMDLVYTTDPDSPPRPQSFKVVAGKDSLIVPIAVIASQSKDRIHWLHLRWSFTANDKHTLLQLISLTEGRYGPLLNMVNLWPVESSQETGLPENQVDSIGH
jgi:hypothetical protein